MSTVIDCPSCQRKLRVPQEFVGKSVRCPTCGATFDAADPAPAAPPAAAPAPAATAADPAPLLTVPIQLELDDPAAARPAAAEGPPEDAPAPRRREAEREGREERDERRPRRRLRRDFEPCPRCDEDVRRGAVVCPFCGLDLEEQGDGHTRRQPVRRDAEPHRGGVVQALGIASLVSGVFYLFPVGLPLGIAAWVMGRRDLRKMDEGTMDPGGRKKTRDGRLCGLVGTLLNSVFACGILGLIFVVVMEASRATPPPQPAPWQNNPPAGKVNPPVGQKPPARPPGNNFTLRVNPQLVILRRGESRNVTITIDRAAEWRGGLTVAAEDADELDGLDVTPDEVKVAAWQTAATFKITADRDADLGQQTITFTAKTDAGEEVSLDIRVTVVGGR